MAKGKGKGRWAKRDGLGDAGKGMKIVEVGRAHGSEKWMRAGIRLDITPWQFVLRCITPRPVMPSHPEEFSPPPNCPTLPDRLKGTSDQRHQDLLQLGACHHGNVELG